MARFVVPGTVLVPPDAALVVDGIFAGGFVLIVVTFVPIGAALVWRFVGVENAFVPYGRIATRRTPPIAASPQMTGVL